MKEEKEYLVRGALLSCDMGAQPKRLNLLTSHGVYIKDHPMIMEDDCAVNVNIMPFGVCKNTGCPCVPSLIGKWQCLKGNAVTTDSYLVCACGGLIQPESSGQEFGD